MADITKQFSIEFVTNQQVVEKFGDTLRQVLGTYEENVAVLRDYSTQQKALREELKGLEKTEQALGRLNAEQLQRQTQLIAKDRELSQAKKEVQQTMRSQEKIMQSANGTYNQQSLLLGQLKSAWRAMSVEQRAGNQDMLKYIQSLDKSMKTADASIGNFQRNVGNYPTLLNQIMPVQGRFASGMQKVAETAGVGAKGIAALGVGVGAAVGAFALFRKAQESTQAIGDTVAIKVAGWQGTWDRFIRLVATSDFSNFLEQLKRAKEVGEEVARVLDELFERNNSYMLQEAKGSLLQQERLAIMRDQTKTNEERIAAGKAFIATEGELANARKEMAEDEYNATLRNAAAQTNQSEDKIRLYIEEYNANRKLVQQYERYQDVIKNAPSAFWTVNAKDAVAAEKAQKKAKDDYAAFYANLSKTDKAFIDSHKSYQASSDELITAAVTAGIKFYTAEAEGKQRVARASATVSGLTKKETNEIIKQTAAIDSNTNAKKTNLSIDSSIKSQFSDISFKFQDVQETPQIITFTADDFKEQLPPVDAVTAMFDEWLKEDEAAMAQLAKDGAFDPIHTLFGQTLSDKEFKAFKNDLKDKAFELASEVTSAIAEVANNSINARYKREVAALESETDAKQKELDRQYDKGLISYERYNIEKEKLENEKEQKQQELEKQQFERQKRVAILQALINTALGITRALLSLPSPTAWVEAAMVAALGALQVATISTQTYASGGAIDYIGGNRKNATLKNGRSHAQGGHQIYIDGQHFGEMESGEAMAIINKRDASTWAMASRINSRHGRSFANGGFVAKYASGGAIGLSAMPSTLPNNASNEMVAEFRRYNSTTVAMIAATNKRIDRLKVALSVGDVQAAANKKQVYVSRSSF